MPSTTETTDADERVGEILAELAALEDQRMRAVNERHGDDHGVNLTRLRAIAKRLKTDQGPGPFVVGHR